MTAPITITHGIRTTTFAVEGGAVVPVSVVDDFGRDGTTTYGPEWASPEATREAEDRLAAVDQPRRRKKR